MYVFVFVCLCLCVPCVNFLQEPLYSGGHLNSGHSR